MFNLLSLPPTSDLPVEALLPILPEITKPLSASGDFSFEELRSSTEDLPAFTYTKKRKRRFASVSFLPHVEVRALFHKKITPHYIKMNDVAGNLHQQTKIPELDVFVRRRLKWPIDPYERERKDVESAAKAALKLKKKKITPSSLTKKIKKMNRRKEIFSLEEATELLNSCKKQSKLSPSSLLQIQRALNDFNTPRKKTIYNRKDPTFKVEINPNKTLLVSYSPLPQQELENYETMRIMAGNCFNGPKDQIIPSLKQTGVGGIAMIPGCVYESQLGGYVVYNYKTEEIKRFHVILHDTGKVLETSLDDPSYFAEYLSFSEYLDDLEAEYMLTIPASS